MSVDPGQRVCCRLSSPFENAVHTTLLLPVSLFRLLFTHSLVLISPKDSGQLVPQPGHKKNILRIDLFLLISALVSRRWLLYHFSFFLFPSLILIFAKAVISLWGQSAQLLFFACSAQSNEAHCEPLTPLRIPWRRLKICSRSRNQNPPFVHKDHFSWAWNITKGHLFPRKNWLICVLAAPGSSPSHSTSLCLLRTWHQPHRKACTGWWVLLRRAL